MNPGPSAPESSTLTTRLASHPWRRTGTKLRHCHPVYYWANKTMISIDWLCATICHAHRSSTVLNCMTIRNGYSGWRIASTAGSARCGLLLLMSRRSVVCVCLSRSNTALQRETHTPNPGSINSSNRAGSTSKYWGLAPSLTSSLGWPALMGQVPFWQPS